ncbi:MAG TPA: UPF0175 family protein [Phycisphaerales bacterium]|jgi:hypothetical protein|nr:UPF0175 family protein [Phycisphaerales bacterium]
MCLHVNLNLNLPAELEERIRREMPDLELGVRESFLIDLFRREVLSHHDLSRVLGLNRFDTDAWLKKRNVFEGSPTFADVEQDWRTIEHLFGKRG